MCLQQGMGTIIHVGILLHTLPQWNILIVVSHNTELALAQA